MSDSLNLIWEIFKDYLNPDTTFDTFKDSKPFSFPVLDEIDINEIHFDLESEFGVTLLDDNLTDLTVSEIIEHIQNKGTKA